MTLEHKEDRLCRLMCIPANDIKEMMGDLFISMVCSLENDADVADYQKG